MFLSDQFRRNLKEEVQEKILRQNFATLQALQIAAIEWDDTLSQFKRQQGRKTYGERPPWVQQSQEPAKKVLLMWQEGPLQEGLPCQIGQEGPETARKAGRAVVDYASGTAMCP